MSYITCFDSYNANTRIKFSTSTNIFQHATVFSIGLMNTIFLLELLGALLLFVAIFSLGYTVGRIKGQELGRQRFIDELPAK